MNENKKGEKMKNKFMNYYDVKIEDAKLNFAAAQNLLYSKKYCIYHDLMVEEDPLSHGTLWHKYAYAIQNDKIYKYYLETDKWGEEIKSIDNAYNSNKNWKAEPINQYLGTSFDEFAQENKIVLKRDMNWAIKMLAQEKIVYREEFPEVILFPIGMKNNPETSLTVDDLFAEDWTIFRGKSLKEVLVDFDNGKSIRRKSWYPELLMGKYSKDIQLNMQDLQARDWEVVDVVAEVDQIQKQHLKDRNER
jgi:hypothetical protein